MQPRLRTIVALDVEQSTTRNNVQKARLRIHMYDLLERVLLACGITEDRRDPPVDRGDGALVMVHPVDEVPKSLLLTRFVPLLRDGLAAHNASHPRYRFRLRVALHAGEVHYDQRGAFGEDIDITCRLLDAPELKTKLRHTAAPMVLVVSNHIYQSVIRHGYDSIDMAAFDPLVTVSVGACSHYGWVSTLSDTVDENWSFHPATGDASVDTFLHLAGQELDALAEVKALDPTVVANQITFRTYPIPELGGPLSRIERNELPGAG